jgi:hypothetical protein
MRMYSPSKRQDRSLAGLAFVKRLPVLKSLLALLSVWSPYNWSFFLNEKAHFWYLTLDPFVLIIKKKGTLIDYIFYLLLFALFTKELQIKINCCTFLMYINTQQFRGIPLLGALQQIVTDVLAACCFFVTINLLWERSKEQVNRRTFRRGID